MRHWGVPLPSLQAPCTLQRARFEAMLRLLADLPTCLAMPDLFISYAREDRDTALALAQAMQSQGIDVWWDRELTGGGDFAVEIERNLRAAPVAVVLWSAASIVSDFVRDESGRARDLGKLLPVRISNVELPLGFGTLHTLDLLEWDGDPDDSRCRALLTQVRQRLASAGPRNSQADETARLAALAQLASEDTLGHRRQRRRLVLALGVAGAVAVGGLGALGWRRFNQHEALAHLAQGLEDHFANPPRLESAQSEYAAALELDPDLSPAHYYLAHLYAQMMLRGSPPPTGEVLDALRTDARTNFELALDDADRLDGVQRVIARSQLALLGQADAASPVSRPTEVAAADPVTPVPVDAPPPAPRPPVSTGGTGPSTGTGAGRERPVPPAGSEAATARPSAVAASTPRVRAPAPMAQAAQQHSEGLFSPDRDARLAAGTSLTLDPAAAAESLPSAIATARRAVHDAPQAESTRLGLTNLLALLERASPSSLREVRAPLQALLSEVAASPLAASMREPSARLARLVEASAAKAPVAYLQIANEAQRPVAKALAARLAAVGYVTPGIELTGEARAPQRPEVRVQGGSDPDLARWCQRALSESAGAGANVVALRRAQPSTDTYELWFDKALCAPGGRNVTGCGS